MGNTLTIYFNKFIHLTFAALKNKIFWYLVSRYFVLGIQFLASILLATRLGAYYFGIWSFILLLVSIGIICNWGISNALMIFMVQYKTEPEKRDQFTFCSIILTAGASLLPIFFLIFDRLVGIPLLTKYHIGNFIYFTVALVILQYFINLFTGILRVKGSINKITIVQTIWPVLMLLLLFWGNNRKLLWLLCSGYMIAQLFSLAVLTAGIGIKKKSCFDLDICKKILVKGFYFFLYNACFWLISLSSKAIISYVYTVKEFGYFTFSYALAQGIMMLTDSLIFLLFPKMIDLLKGDDSQKMLSVIALLRSGYLLPLHLLLYIIIISCNIFFSLLPQYAPSQNAFVFILFTLVTYSFCFGYNSFLLAQNKEKQFALIVIGALILNLISAWILTNVFKCSFDHAILSMLITYALYSIAVNSYALYLLKGAKWYRCCKEIFSPELSILFILSLLAVLFNVPKLHFLIFPVVLLVTNRTKIKQIINAVKNVINNGNAIDI